MTRPEKAEALFRSGYNCAQSVVMAFAPDFGLTQEEAARRVGKSRASVTNMLRLLALGDADLLLLQA